MGVDYSFYVKSIATYASTFLGYNNSVLAIVPILAAFLGKFDKCQSYFEFVRQFVVQILTVEKLNILG